MKSRRGRNALWTGLLLLPGHLVGQASLQAPFAVSDPVVQEIEPERSPLAAGVLEAVLPPLPLGYLYAGDLSRAILPTGLMVGGSALVVLETVELVDWTDDKGSSSLLYLGLAAVVGGYVYGIWDAADAARDHNERLKRGNLSMALLPTPSGVALVGHLDCGGFTEK